MKHETVAKPLAISANKEAAGIGKRGLWKTKSSSETPIPKSPITKAFDFLPWSRSKKTVAEKPAKTKNDSLNTTNGNVGASANATAASSAAPTAEDNRNALTSLNYQRNIFRSSGGLIRDILNEKVNRDDRILRKSNGRKARQVKGRNKSLDINELINCVERELATPNGDGQHNGEGKTHRFLDDTFIENIMRAKEAHQRNIQQEEYEDEEIESKLYKSHHQEPHRTAVDGHDTEDEYFYQQQQELAKLYQNSDSLKSVNGSPRHILFNDENTVYFIKKELPVNKTLKNCDKERKHSENILKARLKFKKFTNDNPSSASHELKSMVLNNNRVVGNSRLQSPAANSKKSILQRQITNSEQYSSLKARCSPDAVRKRSPSAGRYQPPSRVSPNHPRRKSLTDGAAYDQNSMPSLCDNGNSSTSSMGSGASSGGGILNERSKCDKPRKKLSFREPVVSAKPTKPRPSSEVFTANTNVLNFQNINNSNGDPEGHSRRTTPTTEIAPTEDEFQKVSK